MEEGKDGKEIKEVNYVKKGEEMVMRKKIVII